MTVGLPHVVEITAEQTHDLRLRILRDGTPTTNVHFPQDDDPTTFHLGVSFNGNIVVTSTWTPEAAPGHDGVPALHLRGMAADTAVQSMGLGRLLFEAGTALAREHGKQLVWAWARDSALGFYTKLGMRIEGDGFISDETQLPHHVVVLDVAGGHPT
jgi:GNAT superfamily N-acetyltransferase